MLFLFTIGCALAYAAQGILQVPTGNDQILIEAVDCQANRIQVGNEQPDEYVVFRLA